MNPKWEGIERWQSLRAQAEAPVTRLSPQGPSAKPTEVLESYTDLYEFAPVGYITIDRDDKISENNLVGTYLAGRRTQ